MAQTQANNSTQTSPEVKLLQKQLAAAIEAGKAETNKSNVLQDELNGGLIKMLQASNLIKDDEKRKTFIKLLDIHKLLLTENQYISASDNAGKVWFTEITDISGDVAFVPKQNNDAKTPEFIELSNFIKEMKAEWMDNYFQDFDDGNEQRYKYNALANTYSQK